MRLLHANSWRFQDFFDSSIPEYAILSHRWGSDEISYQDLSLAIRGSDHICNSTCLFTKHDLNLDGEGLCKIQKCRELAVAHGYKWVWIDTCCINKESSAELSKAINSMYKWYSQARVCYVYLSDFECRGHGVFVGFHEGYLSTYRQSEKYFLANKLRGAALEDFKQSKWFTRGWTLQELLAPQEILFFDRSWNFFGTRGTLSGPIQAATGIDVCHLCRGISRSLETISVAKKMSWVSCRETSRAEDMAYCMLGLLGVNMPLLYGEGGKAFMRLQLEIINKSDDESIFAWNLRSGPKGSIDEHLLHWENWGMLAPGPSSFAGSGNVEILRGERAVDRLPYAMTNQGLHLRFNVNSTQMPRLKHGGERTFFSLKLNCCERTPGSMNELRPIEVQLEKKIPGRSLQWKRHKCHSSVTPLTKPEDDEDGSPFDFYVRQFNPCDLTS